jgi:lipid A 3-O-deacylase
LKLFFVKKYFAGHRNIFSLFHWLKPWNKLYLPRMKMVSKGVLLSLNLFLASSIAGFCAEEVPSNFSSSAKLSLDDTFRTGWHEATAGAGWEVACIGGKGRPAVDYAMAYVQAGYFIYDAAGSGFFRGNLEILPEAFGAGIYQTTGHYIAGGSIYLRYNFIHDDWRVVPYLQGGAGLTSMDIDHQYDGMNFNFNLGMAAGMRYLVDRHCSLNLEILFQHISNADLGSRNIGLNSAGPRLGVSWFF